MRASDADASLYWLVRMLEGGDDPVYIGRRLVRFAAEDVGLADPRALILATSAMDAAHKIGVRAAPHPPSWPGRPPRLCRCPSAA